MKAWTEILPEPRFLPQTRVHTLGLSRRLNTQVWVKREDETSLGIPGFKLRKYASLLPFIQVNTFNEILLTGGAYSNHLASFPQLLHERNIGAHLFMRGEAGLKITGNHFLIRLLNEESRLHWIERKDWQEVMSKMSLFAEQLRDTGKSVLILNEGAYTPASLPGALSLAQDIHRNETEHSVFFEHVYIDAGTGFSALAALLEDYHLYPQRHWHILSLHDDRETLHRKLSEMHAWFQHLKGKPMPFPDNWICYTLPKALGFGKVNHRVLDEVKYMARTFGLLCDPVYSAKLWILLKEHLSDGRIHGNILAVQSGGTSLFGFMDRLF